MSLNLNDIIELPDGRIGTICYHGLDGNGGIWGEQTFAMPPGGFSPDLPAPDFMLREKTIENQLKEGLSGHKDDMECVEEIYELVKSPGYTETTDDN